ncbi:MobV family relaxase [Vibrio astriarenae]
MTTSILRFEKLKTLTAINQSESHIYRFSATPNADESRSHLNCNIIGNKGIVARLNNIFQKLGIKPRKNAVLAMDCILSLSNDAFKSKEDIDKFMIASKEFLEMTFKGRCISAVIHLDETTPHVHATIVPIDKDYNKDKWKLNARDLFSKSKLSRFQKEYYFCMKKYFPELRAPQFGRKASHKKIKSFYESISQKVDKNSELTNNMREIGYNNFINNEYSLSNTREKLKLT